MKKYRFLVIVIWVWMWLGAISDTTEPKICHAARSTELFYVKWVSDGDTITLADGRRVRYIGINTPEIAHENRPADPFGNPARSCNKKLVLGKKVRLEMDVRSTDSYGRTLAYVFLKDGTFVNAELIKAGYAYCLYVRPNIRYHQKLLDDQRLAMRHAKGMWHALPGPGGVYVGHRESRRFHDSDCYFGNKINPSHRHLFYSLRDAFWEGYAPCQKCRPFIKILQHP